VKRFPSARRLLALTAAAWLSWPTWAWAQDYEREARWEKTTLATLDQGEPVYLAQANGHRFLGLWQPAQKPRGAVLVVHGRGWAPDFELYGALRTQIADAGWSTLSIQMTVLPVTAKLGDYVSVYPDAIERIKLAVDWLHAKGFERVAIVSHSLGATMANQYLIRAGDGKVGAWAFLSILNGLEDMFRLRIPVLDLYADHDWEVIRVGADERRKQIERIPGSRQVMVRNADHFYEDHRPEVVAIVVQFLDQAFANR
jgi:pimeloyl-ACP methyl ester carboxylesterase